MCVNVNTISQSTDDERVGYESVEVADEDADEIITIACAVAGTNNIDDMAGVEVGVSFIEKHQRCVGCFLEPSWIIGIVQA